MSLGALAFLSPWLLTGLVALPIIYWLLRTVPPRPRQIAFPATRILVGLENRERTPDKTPWWLMLIRLLAAAAVILALAEPMLNPDRTTALRGSGPVAIVVDNGWASATRWAERQRLIASLIDEAEAARRPVVIAGTAEQGRANVLQVLAPAAARVRAAALVPQPFAPGRGEALKALETALGGKSSSSIVWLADGLDHGEASAFAAGLARLADAGLSVVESASGHEPLAVFAGLDRGGKLTAKVIRAGGGARELTVTGLSTRGERLAEARIALSAGAASASATFELPLELRNQVTRVAIAGERSAGAVHLLDARSQWHRVGLLSGSSLDLAQPLLWPLYYIRRALEPFAELVEPAGANFHAGFEQLVRDRATVAVLADIGTISGDTHAQITKWVEQGGVLVRFAGPRLEKGGDDLLPVALRFGGRTLGGALSWSTPQSLARFPDDSLFVGLAVPKDVKVQRQVLADPARIDPETQVWARLEDGTPLVTARRLGEGRIVLFHVTANSDWSNLPLSGLFVEMLRRISTLGSSAASGGTKETTRTSASDSAKGESATKDQNVLAPLQVLDGQGQLVPPPPTAQAIAAARLSEIVPGPAHPPGYYGAGGTTRALNIARADTVLKSLPSLPAGTETRAYAGQAATPLKPHLLALALALLLIDVVAVIILQGGLAALGSARSRQARTSAGAIAVAVLFGGLLLAFAPTPAAAQTTRSAPSGLSEVDQKALKATSKVTFGYVLTGDPGVDGTSLAGLQGLVTALTLRTAVEPGPPAAVKIDSDEIAFYPILYWPVLANAAALSEATLAKIDAYMKQGGMIIFDTRDFGSGLPVGIGQSAGRGETPLQRLLGRLDIPRLEPVPEGHVLTRSFYLLRTFPGRWDGGQLWVEAGGGGDIGPAQAGAGAGAAEPANGATRQARRSDGVSSILVTPNDFASAWALDQDNRPLFPVVPGGEQQREYAFRTGINIVMYALTGNYKADQVHVPALLERLGQ
ncbi:MAG: DUF4159 domain-containing protein [Hyphomicrobiaceae bacterium]